MVKIVRGMRWELVRHSFMDWFGVERATADTLVLLWGAQGEAVQVGQLSDELRISRLLSTNAVEVRICALRKAMESEAVDTLPSGGYCLTDVGLAECDQALDQTARELLERRSGRRPSSRPRPSSPRLVRAGHVAQPPLFEGVAEDGENAA